MKHTVLIIGDAVALLVVTLVGFASHGELGLAFLPHMAASLLPLCLGWYLLAPSLGLFQDAAALQPGQLWRPAFVMLFAGPFAALVRGILLGLPVIPAFAIVLSTTAAAALIAWRLLWLLLRRRR